MTSRRRIIVFVLSIVVFFIIMFLLLLYFYNLRNNKDFINILKKVDSTIVSGTFTDTDELLNTAYKFVNSPLEYKQLLKRSFQTGNNRKFSYFSEKAYKKYPKDEQILSIYIYSLIITKNFNKAQEVLNTLNTLNLPEYLTLVITINSGEYNSEDNIFYQAINEKKLSIFNKLFQITEEKDFLINSALLYLEKGDFEKANEVLDSFQNNNLQNKKLKLLVKYANGQYKEVLDFLMLYDFGFSTKEIYLIKIDIYLKMENYTAALISLAEFISLYPGYSVLPYINIIFLNSFINVPDVGKFINLSLSRYPYNRVLLLTIVDYYVLNNEEKIAIDIITKYMEASGSDMELEIILKQIEGTSDPEKFVNNIQDLVNKNPDNVNAAQYLAWSLLKNNNYQSLEKFLDQKYNNANTAWVLFFKAIVCASKGEDNIALTQFQNSYLIENNWETLYNMGILSAYTKDYQSAIEYYQNSENMLAIIPQNSRIRSMIRTTLSSLLYETKDYDNAYREIRNALDLDVSNLKAYLLLKKLESNSY